MHYEHHQSLVVWHNTWGGGFRDVYARRVSASGTLLYWFTVATDAGSDGKSRLQPDVACNPVTNECLVVHMLEDSPGVYAIRGRRVAWDGSYLGPEIVIYAREYVVRRDPGEGFARARARSFRQARQCAPGVLCSAASEESPSGHPGRVPTQWRTGDLRPRGTV